MNQHYKARITSLELEIEEYKSTIDKQDREITLLAAMFVFAVVVCVYLLINYAK